MLVRQRVTPSVKFASNHLYAWTDRGTVRVQCLAQEHKKTSLTRARTQTVRSGDERTYYESTSFLTKDSYLGIKKISCR